MRVMEKRQIGNKRVMPFTIPSGIAITDPLCAARIARRVDELGIITLKSTGLKERVMPTEELYRKNPDGLEFGCREPIYVQLGDGIYANAVKLINKGAKKTREEIERANFPKDKLVVASVFAANESDLVEIIKILDPVVDAFKCNLGCPHGEKIGMAQGQDPEMVYSFARAGTHVTDKPFIVKFPANFTAECVRAAVRGGAYGGAAINTIPCEPVDEKGRHLLWNLKGGKSGRELISLGLQRTLEMRAAAGKDFFIIGEGGIFSAKNARAYFDNGADAVGLGTVLTDMDEEAIAKFFPAIVNDLENGTDYASALIPKVNMQRRPATIRKIMNKGCDFRIYEIDISIDAKPGQFVFAGLYGGERPEEKPFSVMDDNPLTIGVLERGLFTRKFGELREGDEIYVKGPCGKGVSVPPKSNVVLVGGGCGIAGLALLAKRLSADSNVLTLLAAKDNAHLAYLDEFRKYGEIRVITEDGSSGKRGLVTDLMYSLPSESYFFNCGPKGMVNSVLPLELSLSSPEKIYSSLDLVTRCGMGICGSCVDDKGRRTCKEGPFMSAE